MNNDQSDSAAGMLRVQPEQRRAKLMLARIERAAVEVIAENGRDRFTTAQVAERAGCSFGALYLRFEDRKAILDWLYPNMVEGLGELREGIGEDPPPAPPSASASTVARERRAVRARDAAIEPAQ